ncbi:hypothetical protein TNCV_2190781 [Trichonephila clavipes]|uniref:Uncharacterized protein n=1 Tax=Trichonephila clavipes TaxID=2585209 RepID=A0A8X6R8H0_TRICX|nr:hypothetical protein TNCV_2190781 [Trichonephila clavipes]
MGSVPPPCSGFKVPRVTSDKDQWPDSNPSSVKTEMMILWAQRIPPLNTHQKRKPRRFREAYIHFNTQKHLNTLQRTLSPIDFPISLDSFEHGNVILTQPFARVIRP